MHCDHCGATNVPLEGVWRNNWPTYYLCERCSDLSVSTAMDERIKARLWKEGRWESDSGDDA